jgi:two-component system, OmpR family, response regulator MprA
MQQVLLAEDDSALRLLYALWLQHAGCEVVACADGREALAALERGFAPDAAVLDVDMPYVDGLSVCRYLHARDPHASIVVVSGVDDARCAARAAGASDVLVKPCRRDELLAALAGTASAQPAAA